MNITIIIGHRGVGKSSLLERWKTYEPQKLFFDLDKEIENSAKQSIDLIFKDQGEKAFREIEKKAFSKIIYEASKPLVIAVGAGFPVDSIPAHAKVIFVKRESDLKGRIFLDRPRLNPEMDALEEFHLRRKNREPHFLKRANLIYNIPEGLFSPDEVEKSILLENANLEALVTLIPNLPPTKTKGAVYEWRSDLLSVEEFLKMGIESHEVLYSVRDEKKIPDIVEKSKITIDWDVSRELPNLSGIKIISTHEDDIDQAILSVSPYINETHMIKLCPMVYSWAELLKGWQWQKEDPRKRSFLPRSTDGRWSWFRLMMKGKQRINFIKDGQGSSADQPTIWEWLSLPPKSSQFFAAVLGDPIAHSYSPTFHKDYFKKLNQSFFKIKISKEEWNDALGILFLMGLRKAAVTSPLKSLAGELTGSQVPLNTLAWNETQKCWEGTNTDFPALKEIFKNFENSKSVVIWGGGGLLPSLQKCLPFALPFSARTGEPRLRIGNEINPEMIVWAAGQADIRLVSEVWSPRLIIDMSYVENSPGRILAEKKKSQYISGLELFEKQGNLQQMWWKNYK